MLAFHVAPVPRFATVSPSRALPAPAAAPLPVGSPRALTAVDRPHWPVEWQIVFIGVFIALSWQTLNNGHPIDWLAPLQGDGSAPGFGPMMAGAAVLCLSFLGFLGFDAVSTLAEESRNARRDVPRAIILTTLFAGLLYVSQLVLPGSTFANADA